MLTTLGVIFILGLILGELADKIHLPKLVGFILVGVIMSPDLLNLLDEKTILISDDLRKLALVIILARAGLSLKTDDLKKVGRPAILLSFVPACFEIVAITIAAPILFGITYIEGAIIGTVVAAVSPAVVVPSMIKIIEERYGTNKSIPHLIMAGASIDDVFVIILFTSFTQVAQGGTFNFMKIISVPISIILGIILGGIFGILTGMIYNKTGVKSTIQVIIFLSFSFFMLEIEKLLEGIISISGLIGIMAFGVTLLNKYPEYSQIISSKLSKLWIPAQILLFVLVGTTIDIKYIKQAGLIVILLLIIGLIFRGLGVYTSLIKTNLTIKERIFCIIAYMPKATVQAAIGAIPLSMGLACGKLVVTIAIMAIIITAPIGAWGIENSYKKLLEKD